jgi:uncharacterized repeat protein (TIGR03803 family)
MSFAKFAQPLLLLILGMSAIITARPAHAQKETILHKFRGGSDGETPFGLTPDGKGNFFGLTGLGGVDGYYGTVFELSPSGKGWKETVIYRFTGGADGAFPLNATVTFDSWGNFYGTTFEGGANNLGTVFEFSPTGSGWTETVLYRFTGGADGRYPQYNLIMDLSGNLYGSSGHIFELTPSGNGWKLQVIYSGGSYGLTMDAVQNIYGVNQSTAFELSPDGNGGWTPTVLHKFGSYVQGYFPMGGPILDKAGNLYGTASEGGAFGYGTVYKLTPRKKTGPWTLTVLYSFTGGKDGGVPLWPLVFDAAGNIFGVTDDNGELGIGTVFELVAPVGKGRYQEKTLWDFNGTDGGAPGGGVVLDSAGNLYGATDNGGLQCPDDFACGVAFEITP